MKPDYAFWARQTEYTLTDSAQLCCDSEPQPWTRENISPKVEAMARRIKAEVTPCRDTSDTIYSPNYGGGAPLPIHTPGEQFYQRADLREWAERTEQRASMPFLFPEDRAESAGTIGAVRGLPRLGGAMPSLEVSYKSVVVTVTGRDAIPVRALPFVTGRSLSPDAVVQEMAERKEARKLTKGLRAYHLHDDGTPVEMLPKEWDLVDKNLKALSARLEAPGLSREESYAFWQRDSILCLPPGVFLWRDEFDGAFFGGDIWAILDEREGDREWIAATLIPNELHEAVMEGFEPATNSPQDSTDKEPDNDAVTLQSALTVIGAMLALFLKDTDEDGKKLSPFAAQRELIQALEDRNPLVRGLKERNMKGVFAAANKAIDEARKA